MSRARETYNYRGLTLLPQSAVWQAQRRTLWVADPHFGKAASFRRLGQPAPQGTTRENLARLGALIDAYSAERLVILGDFLHARQARGERLFSQLRAWRGASRLRACVVVRGNHDAHAGDAPQDCGFDSVDEPFELGGVIGRHHPLDSAACETDGPMVLAGHVHPVTRLVGPGRDRLRLPCFCLRGRQIVLPSFGEFTSGHVIEPIKGQTLCVTTGAHLFLLGASAS